MKSLKRARYCTENSMGGDYDSLFVLSHVRALIEHHAFSAFTHGGIGNFGARRLALLGETLQHLCCPNDRHVRGFADPQYFFLNLGQSLPTAFDR